MSDFQVSEGGRIVTIFGIRYDIELFRHIGVGPIGSCIEIVSRGGGCVTMKRLPDEGYRSALEQILALTDFEMADGDGAREIARKALE